MKKIALMVLILVPFIAQSAPEKIQPKTLVLKSREYYQQQAEQWRNEISRYRGNGSAWLNYYASAVFSQESREQLTRIVTEMTAAIPNPSYEWLVVKGWHEGYNASAKPYLDKAYALDPSKVDAYGSLQLMSELDLNDSKRLLFSQLLFDNSLISSSLLNYSYNVLMSVEPSAILITEGESTTIPLMVLQDVLHVRQDVRILDLDLLTNGDYLSQKFKSLNLRGDGPIRQDNLRAALCALLPANNQGRKFYYALTLSNDNLAPLKESLYVVGLASVHSVTNVDNVSQIRRNLEKEFMMDYLRVNFNGESSDATGKVLSSNYLVPMILLYESYMIEGALDKAKDLRKLMEQVAHESGKESVMARFLGDGTTDAIPYFPFALGVKNVDGRFRYFSSTLYAEESEVTNQQYNVFLNYLKANNLNDLRARYTFDFSEYTEPALSMMKNYAADNLPTKKSKYFTNYPAVNVSYEAALAYCEWLTDQYNHASDRKFKKVKFRLPTVSEWQLAAASIKDPTSWNWDDQTVEVKYTLVRTSDLDKDAVKKMMPLKDPEILYPWFRYWGVRDSPKNSRGCYLGNFKAPDSITCPGIMKRGLQVAADGFMAMAPTESYFPNDIGLYDVVGNVAEMSSDKGKACGGSWNHTPQESTMRSVNLYTKPDASIGFRVFMEIIEK